MRGYDVEAMLDCEYQIFITQVVTNDANDRQRLVPILEAVPTSGRISESYDPNERVEWNLRTQRLLHLPPEIFGRFVKSSTVPS